ncbi:MAG: 2Fe-2S iron-sulfur cluster-binding protein [Deltaproteobacteria bacterium]|nr:2Fe-2S iron-sulfur cluster-binding protein [Deltaproteobacteria bacterium]
MPPKIKEESREEIAIIIKRFDPEQDQEGYFQSFAIPKEAAQGMTIVSALKYIQQNIDPTLAFYYSCEQAVCRGCLLMVNGNEVFACTEPVYDGQKIEPMIYLPVMRDLVVKFIESEIELDPEVCVGCGKCVESCAMDIFELAASGKALVRDGSVRPFRGHAVDCIGCRWCENVCPVKAIQIRQK